MSKTTKQEQEEAKKWLKKTLQKGDTIYTVLRHVSRSGLYRAIELYVIKKNEPLRISRAASMLLEGYDEKHDACKAHGCGMDTGFNLVYNLAYSLYKDGYALKHKWL